MHHVRSRLALSLFAADTLHYSENVEWHGSDSENDSSDSESESGSDDGSNSDDDDGKAPEGEDVEMKEVKVDKLKLTDAEQAVIDAEQAAIAVSCLRLALARSGADSLSLATARGVEKTSDCICWSFLFG